MKLELQGIKKSFDGTEILHGINFSVEGGSALGLLGRNGDPDHHGCFPCR